MMTDEIVYIFKFNKLFRTKIENIINISDKKIYIVSLTNRYYHYGTFGLYREDFYTKKELRLIKINRLNYVS